MCSKSGYAALAETPASHFLDSSAARAGAGSLVFSPPAWVHAPQIGPAMSSSALEALAARREAIAMDLNKLEKQVWSEGASPIAN